jgi:drug/metabolite transporter (DMT)-like permease
MTGRAVRPVRSSSVATGLGVGIGANLIWGLAFLIPVLLSGSSPVAVTLGRYVCYGLLSLLLVVFTGAQLRGHGWPVWRTCLLFAVTGNVGYYFFLVQGVALVSAPVVTVVIGTLPVTVALYGNARRREFPFRRLALPVGLILVGLVVVNISEIDWSGIRGLPLSAQLLGMGCAVVALASWTWFGVANATFLKSHPQISPADWSTMIGVATLGLSVLAAPLLLVNGAGLGRGSGQDPLWALLLGSVVLGVLVSWGGTLLWNRASSLLPVSVAGQLIVFETISGIVYVFAALGKVPPPLTVLGMVVVLTGVLIGIRLSGQR